MNLIQPDLRWPANHIHTDVLGPLKRIMMVSSYDPLTVRRHVPLSAGLYSDQHCDSRI
jgi:hypothetical protein